jgi:nucleoside-diphosphate-sugar epimerase
LTGASGFVGKATLAALLERGCEVTAVARTPPDVAGTYRFAACDLLDGSRTLDDLFSPKIDVVVHLAWCVEHGKFWTSPANLDWVGATLRLARAAERHGVARVVAAGTCYEYAWPQDGNCTDGTLLSPTTLYAVAKDATRRACEAFFAARRIDFAWARIFFLYGPGEQQDRLVPSIARRLVRGEIAPSSRGLAVRDFLDVRDAGRALAALAASSARGAFNVASGQAISIADVVRRLGELAGRPDLVQIGGLADRADEPPRIVADVQRLPIALEAWPTISLDQGLTDALGYWRERAKCDA